MRSAMPPSGLQQERQVGHLELAGDSALGAPADVAEAEAARVLEVLEHLRMLGDVLEVDALGRAINRRLLHERQRLGRHFLRADALDHRHRHAAQPPRQAPALFLAVDGLDVAHQLHVRLHELGERRIGHGIHDRFDRRVEGVLELELHRENSVAELVQRSLSQDLVLFDRQHRRAEADAHRLLEVAVDLGAHARLEGSAPPPSSLYVAPSSATRVQKPPSRSERVTLPLSFAMTPPLSILRTPAHKR